MDKVKHAISLATFGGTGACFKFLSSQGYLLCRGVSTLSVGHSSALGAAIYVISHIVQQYFSSQKTASATADKQPAKLSLQKEATLTILTGVVSNLIFIGLSVSSALTGGALAAVAFVAMKVAIMVIDHFHPPKKPQFESLKKEKEEPYSADNINLVKINFNDTNNNNVIVKKKLETKVEPKVEVKIEPNDKDSSNLKEKSQEELLEEEQLFDSLKGHPLTVNLIELRSETTNKNVLNKFSNYVLNEKIPSSQRRYFLASLVERMIVHQKFNQGSMPDFGCKKFIPQDLLTQMKLLHSIYKNEPLETYFVKQENGEKIPDLDTTEFFVKDEKASRAGKTINVFMNEKGLLNSVGYIQFDLKDIDSFTKDILNCKTPKCERKAGFYITTADPVPKEFWGKLKKFAERSDVDHFYLLPPGPLPLIPNDMIERDLSGLFQKLRFDPQGIYHLVPLSSEDFLTTDKLELLRALCPNITAAKIKDTEIQDFSSWNVDVFSAWMPLFKPTQIKFPRGMSFEEFKRLDLSGMTHLDFSSVLVNKDFYRYLFELSSKKATSFTLADNFNFDSSWVRENNKFIDNPISLRRQFFSTETVIFPIKEEVKVEVEIIEKQEISNVTENIPPTMGNKFGLNLDKYKSQPTTPKRVEPKKEIRIEEKTTFWMPKEKSPWAPCCDKFYNGDWNYASVFMIPAGLTGKLKEDSYSKLWKSLDPCTVSLWLYNDTFESMPTNHNITEINAYQNGRLNDENIERFLLKFPKVNKVCLTGTAVTEKCLEWLKSRYKNVEFIFDSKIKPESIYTELTIENAEDSYNKLVQDYKLLIADLLNDWKIVYEWEDSVDELREKFMKNAKIYIDPPNQEKSKAIFMKGLQLRDCCLFMETFCPEKLDPKDLKDAFKQPNFAFLFAQKMLFVDKNRMVKECPDFKILEEMDALNWKEAISFGGILSQECSYVIDSDIAKGMSLEMLEFVWNCCLISNNMDLLKQKVDQFFKFDSENASANDWQNHLNSIETLLRFSKQWNAVALSNHLCETLYYRIKLLIPEDVNDEQKGEIIIKFLEELMTIRLLTDEQDIKNERQALKGIWKIFNTKKLTENQNESITNMWHLCNQQGITLPNHQDPFAIN